MRQQAGKLLAQQSSGVFQCQGDASMTTADTSDVSGCACDGLGQ